MSFFDKEFKEIFSAELISIVGGLLAGIALVLYTDKLLLIPGMLILLPGFLEMRGNISGSLASRISSGLFLKVIPIKKVNSKIIQGNFIASFLLAIIVTLSLGIVAFLLTFFLFHVSEPILIIVPIIAGVIANLIQIPLTLFLTFFLFRRGHDPNNIMGPFLTSSGDVISIGALLLTLVIL